MRCHVDRETLAVRISGVSATQVGQMQVARDSGCTRSHRFRLFRGGEGVALCLRQNRQMLKWLGPTGS